MNHRLLLVAPMVACILLTSVLAFLVLSSSVKSEPSPPYVPQPDLPSCYDQQNMSQRQINACVTSEQAVWAQYQQTLAAAEVKSGYIAQFAVYQGYISNTLTLWEVATATVMVSLVTLSAWFPRSRAVKAFAVLVLVYGSAVFAFWARADYIGPNLFRALYPSLRPLDNFLSDRALFADGWAYSAFFSFCVAMGGFMALRAPRGVLRALWEGVVFFAAPVLVAFELGIWYYLPAFFDVHATSFTPLWLTNGVVMAVALCFIGVGCVPFLVRMEVRREERLLRGAGFQP